MSFAVKLDRQGPFRVENLNYFVSDTRGNFPFCFFFFFQNNKINKAKKSIKKKKSLPNIRLIT